jgi:hypothetical protein
MRTIMTHTLAGILILAVAGCAASALQRQHEAWQQALQIILECREKRLAGELSSHLASSQCSNSRARQVIAASGYPHMDLVDLFLAYRTALAQRVDTGLLSEAEANLQYAELRTRIVSEEQRRNIAAQQAYSQQLQNYNALLQGLAAWHQATQPPPIPQLSGPVTCSRFGNTITCY